MKYVMTEEDKKIHRVLGDAYKLIESGQQQYLCFALSFLRNDSNDFIYRNVCAKLEIWVMSLLAPSSYLNDWVSNNLYTMDRLELKEIRLQWIEGMIRFIETNSWEI